MASQVANFVVARNWHLLISHRCIFIINKFYFINALRARGKMKSCGPTLEVQVTSYELSQIRPDAEAVLSPLNSEWFIYGKGFLTETRTNVRFTGRQCQLVSFSSSSSSSSQTFSSQLSRQSNYLYFWPGISLVRFFGRSQGRKRKPNGWGMVCLTIVFMARTRN